MSGMKQNNEARLRDLIAAAREKNIEVRSEKLLREVGYRARSGRCSVMGRDVILLDRDTPVADQIEFLTSALAGKTSEGV